MTQKILKQEQIDKAFSNGISLNGLNEDEVLAREEKYGFNEFTAAKNSAFKIFLRQFKNSIIYLLIIAAFIAFALGDFTDGCAITIILLINAALGFSQEFRSERTAEKLSKLIGHHVMVIRNGAETIINKREVVPEDIVVLKEGDIVPADCLVLEANNLFVDESQLTGESEEVAKSPGEGKDRKSQIFSGSIVKRGKAVVQVFATGEKSELGKIATLAIDTKESTKYEQSLGQFSNFLVKMTLFCLAIIFTAKLFILGFHLGVAVLMVYLLFVIALAVAVVPEAMPVITTITLSVGAMKLTKRHVIVKKMSAIEDLGNVTILCTDKTGTLTQNKLTVVGISAADSEKLSLYACAAREVLDTKRKRMGNAFDEAITSFASADALEQAVDFEIIDEIPFDPASRRRSTVIQNKNTKEYFLVSIGSPETILDLSTEEITKNLTSELAADGRKGLRHLAYAMKKIDYELGFDIRENEDSLVFIGIIKFADPLKESSKKTIELAKKLGVGIKIITGDSVEVARYIGVQVGLLGKNDKVLTGDEVCALADGDFTRSVNGCSVFALTNPEQKFKIIEALKTKEVVAYQGDGINDAPSLKLAHVGIAVNTATDVAKESADILLLKNDLKVIVNGIRYGRMTFANINKYIKHTMVGNYALFFALGVIFLLYSSPPLLSVQLLLATVITDVPMVAIASDNVDEEELARPSVFDLHDLMFIAILLAVVTAIGQILFFAFVSVTGEPVSVMQTNMFLYIVLLQLTIIFAVRNRFHFWQGTRPSAKLIFSIIATIILCIAIPYMPVIGRFFSFAPIALSSLGLIFVFQVIYIFIIDFIKHWYNKVA